MHQLEVLLYAYRSGVLLAHTARARPACVATYVHTFIGVAYFLWHDTPFIRHYDGIVHVQRCIEALRALPVVLIFRTGTRTYWNRLGPTSVPDYNVIVPNSHRHVQRIPSMPAPPRRCNSCAPPSTPSAQRLRTATTVHGNSTIPETSQA